MFYVALAAILGLMILQDVGPGGMIQSFLFFCFLGIAWEHYNPGALVAFASFLKGAL